ncbi:MAG: hypothetical protein ACPHER_02955 [Nevskiales bacterium]
MSSLTETQKQQLEALRQERSKLKTGIIKRQLAMLVALIGVSVPYYAMAYDVGPCADKTMECPTVWVAFSH